jgi:hypothetical protein
LIPRRLQIFLRRQIVLNKLKKYSHTWPIDPNSGDPPPGWRGWPEGKRFALVLTHDVETQKGHDRCRELMRLEEGLDLRSSFNFVIERYEVSCQLVTEIQKRGFEVAIHGLKHDGKLFVSKKIFMKRSKTINLYLRKWNATGFHSPSTHHNLEWLSYLNIKYDASTFDTDPFEPQPDGVGTIFPFWTKEQINSNGYVELPYTLPQDFTLFVIMKETNIEIWKKKLNWIAEKGGMALLNVHPDYINFKDKSQSPEEYTSKYYEDFLLYINKEFKGQYWHVLPKEIASFWSENIKKMSGY